MKVTYLNEDWPAIGKNRKSKIYYYLIETSKNPDMIMAIAEYLYQCK